MRSRSERKQRNGKPELNRDGRIHVSYLQRTEGKRGKDD